MIVIIIVAVKLLLVNVWGSTNRQVNKKPNITTNPVLNVVDELVATSVENLNIWFIHVCAHSSPSCTSF